MLVPHPCCPALLPTQGDGEQAEERLVRAQQADRRWGDLGWVRANTRWPPALDAAYARFLGIQANATSTS